MISINERLFKTDPKHSHMVDAMAYMVAAEFAKMQEDYILLFIKKKPRYIPDFIYKWFIKQFVNVYRFRG